MKMKKYGFTLIELMVVLAILALLFGVVPVYFGNYYQEEKLEKALSKIKYDIQYMQSLRLSKTENYTIAFRDSITDGVDVVGVNGVEFDYVCFIDENDNAVPELSEVIKDPFDGQLMMYDFDNTNGQYTDTLFDNININQINFRYNGSIGKIIRFDEFGGIKVYDGSDWNNELNLESNIEFNLFTNPSIRKELIIYPLTADMMIR